MAAEPWGRQLKRWRTVAGLGRARLARAARVSERNIANLEERDQRPSAATVRALTDALTLALADVEGAWTSQERARFAAGPEEETSSPPTEPHDAAPVKAGSPPAHRGRARLIAGGAVTAVLTVALVVAVLLGRPSRESPAAGRIAAPEAGARITSPLDVRGSASLGTDQELWVLLKARNNSFYTVSNAPAPAPVDADGEWVVHTVGVGKGQSDLGKRYELYLVVVPIGGTMSTAARQMTAGHHSVEFKALPAEARVLDSVAVELSAVQN